MCIFNNSEVQIDSYLVICNFLSDDRACYVLEGI